MNEIREIFNDVFTVSDDKKQKGIYSVCSINSYVLEAAIEYSYKKNGYVLIESTCNQINQFGGYAGMTPADFMKYVYSISKKIQFPKEKIIIGGDHIGPFPFKDEDSKIAMEKAKDLIRSCIGAGYQKIHIDTSMALIGDKIDSEGQISKELIAKRSAELVKTSEDRVADLNINDYEPVYVIGTDIPIPGGSDEVLKGRRITCASDLEETINLTKDYFYKNGLQQAWERVIAVVVLPGVEHGDNVIIDYERKDTKNLTDTIRKHHNLVFEAHSTDYQTSKNLRKMVEDKFCILKVGPSLTNALREATFSLNIIEEELFSLKTGFKLSDFINIFDKEMRDNPRYWKDYYSGDEDEMRFSRKYSLFDRSRYYWGNKSIRSALQKLLNNLNNNKIPLPLVSQFFPIQYNKVREGLLNPDPVSLLKDRINNVLDKYSFETGL